MDELRTWLSAIRGYNDLVALALAAQGEHTPLLDIVALYNERIDEQCAALSMLLESLSTAGGTVLLASPPTDLLEVVGETVEAWRARLAPRAIELSLPAEPALVRIDPLKVFQVLTNYLLNAHAYSAPDRPIVVRVEGGEREVRVAVRDEGRGVPSDEQERVWERFYRATNVRDCGQGNGLGLSICRMIIQLHGGAVGLESRVGGGSTFWFTLPTFPPEP